MRLQPLISSLSTLAVEGLTDREVTGISYDSRRVTPGMIYVAIRGNRANGHDYIQNAVERGAVAVVSEEGGILINRAAKIVVADSREAMAQLAVAFYQQPSTRLKVIGVTGTNGKTTVAFLVKHLLETAGIRTGLLGTIRYEIGERVIPATRTTPESLEIQQMLAQMVRSGCQACVMEVSSHALEQKRVHGIEFDVVLFTNLTQDHLDYHGDMETYFSAKRKLFCPTANSHKSKTAVINIDDAFGERLAKETELAVQIHYGIEKPAAVRAVRIQLGADATRMVIQTPDGQFDCCLPLIGRHNVYNALAAVGAVRAMNVNLTQIRQALNTMTPVAGRLERLELGQPFGVLVDYAHTDDALSNVLRTLREITAGRLLLVFGCGGCRDAGKRPKMGKVGAELADHTWITSDNPRKELAADIARQIEVGFRSVRVDGYRVELDRRRAIEEAIRGAKAGDTVLIAGKGHETYQEFEDTIVPFDDRDYAQETLETLGYGPRR